MKVICPQCGGAVEVNENLKTAKCPFCRTSFILSDTQKAEISSAFVTKVIEVNPNELQNELDIYSLFGWDYKDKEKQSNRTQVTLQRNTRAPWCTEELLNNEKRFFELRQNYYKDQIEFDKNKFRMYAGNLSYQNRNKTFAAMSMIFFTFLFILFGVCGIALAADDIKNGWIVSLVGIPFLPLGIVLMNMFLRRGEKETNNMKKEIDEKFALIESKYTEKQNERMAEMEKIASWAKKQMKEKFGYEFDLKINI